MRGNDSVWLVALSLCFLGVSEMRAETDEEAAKKAYEQLQGGATGRGQTQSSGGAVQGSAGLKAPPAGMVEPGQKLGPDGTPVPAPKKEGKEEESLASKMAKGGAVAGGLGGAALGGLFGGGVGAVPGWVVGAGVGAAGGAFLGWAIGKIGEGLGKQVSANADRANKISGQ